MESQKNVEEPLPLMFTRLRETGFSPRKLQGKTTSIIGLGGLGVLVANMLVRLGIGHVILIDQDVVGEENLNRLGYGPDDVGKSKVSATKEKMETFQELRGRFTLQVDTYKRNIIAWAGLKEVVERSEVVFGCLDNLEARLEVNHWILKLTKPLVDGGTSPNGLRGRIDTVIPPHSPCLGCYYDDSTLTSLGEENDYLCDRSVPTVMNLVASLQVDQGIRIMLKKNGIYPRILINLEGQVKVSGVKNVKKRANCRYCGKIER
ncbi:MAG: ThiF family adenylyltransferase [Candidatus Korarchaeota archaeon]|nr:ThiF family adenylyltransferase [Candidatus Korarchaeota archaeon]NIU84161.1 hypothetical protein [Candidatus Thorarchaeota archaeon]NIW14306.1 hypothetical protein [Candidatus Thorarchaeota archaeon]NIW52403.1 hypothetical protein [Candidatus Korarchaeota archaeon]